MLSGKMNILCDGGDEIKIITNGPLFGTDVMGPHQRVVGGGQIDTVWRLVAENPAILSEIHLVGISSRGKEPPPARETPSTISVARRSSAAGLSMASSFSHLSRTVAAGAVIMFSVGMLTTAWFLSR